MFDFIAGWLILSAAIWGTAALLPGVRVDSFGAAAGVAAVFSLLNFFFGWIVFIVLGVATLGIGFILFSVTAWVVNAIMLMATNSLMDSFHVRSIWWALGASAIISAFAGIGQAIVF